MASTRLRFQGKPKAFLGWLEDHTGYLWWRRLPVNHSSADMFSIAHGRTMEKQKDFTIFVMDTTGTDWLGREKGSRPRVMISPMSVKVQPVDEGEIDVTLLCHQPAMWGGYHAELVAAIIGRYPDAHWPPHEAGDRSTLEPEITTNVGATPGWLPKTPKTRERWREAYLVLMQQQEEYADRGDPPPTKKDQRTRLSDDLCWSRGDDTIDHILKAGREGLI